MLENLSGADLDALGQSVETTLALSGNCAQTSFSVLNDAFALEGGPILKALTAFPGLALRGETCGAVTGCLMAIGVIHGRDRLDDWDGYVACLRVSRRFCRRFEEQHGSTSCARLLEAKLGRTFNLARRGETLEYLAAGGREACRDIIRSAVEIAAKIIAESRPPAVRPSPPPARRRLRPGLQKLVARAYVLIRARSPGTHGTRNPQ
jgi:C_GCAxxG_C_C family probable redox protein